MHSTSDRHALFRRLFDLHFDALLAYARRRTDQLSDAEDVVAETFVVAWRRLDDLPLVDNERLSWLYGVARRVIGNHHRGARRRARLGGRLRDQRTAASLRPASRLPAVIDAMARLPETDREVLRLMAWEGLSHREIGAVAGISENAVAIRLHRARGRLTRELRAGPGGLKGIGRIGTFMGWKGSASGAPEREETR
jgi:RNA polymerase sigma-70 factor (ECF subfamily)